MKIDFSKFNADDWRAFEEAAAEYKKHLRGEALKSAKAIVVEHGFTAKELGLSGGGKADTKTKKSSAAPGAVIFKHGDYERHENGRGKLPAKVRTISKAEALKGAIGEKGKLWVDANWKKP